MSGSRMWLKVYVTLVVVVLIAPVIVVVLTSLSAGNYLHFPPQGLSLKWYQDVINDNLWLQAVRTSIKVSLGTVVVALVIGVPASIAVAWHEWPGRRLVENLLLTPLMVPFIVLAVSYAFMFSHTIGQTQWWQLSIVFSVVTVPYLCRTLSVALRMVSKTQEEAAMSLGASRLVAWALVIAPAVRNALFAGCFFVFVLSFDELVIAIFVAGAGLTTLPMRLYSEVQYELEPTVAAVSTLLIVITVVAVLFMERLVGVRRLLNNR